MAIDDLPKDLFDTTPALPLSVDAKHDLYVRIRDARFEGEKPISPMFVTLSSFTRPIRMSNRIRLQNRIKEIGYTGQPEGTFCVFDEDSKTITVVAGNHRTLALMNLDQCVMTYVMKVNLKKEDISLSQIAFTVEQFFKGTQTDPDLYDCVLQLQKWMDDKAKKGVQKSEAIRNDKLRFRKTRCLLEH